MKLDKLDLSILANLQNDARISNVELANKVGLSASACSRRLDQLESNKVIEDYQAVISNKALEISELTELKKQTEDVFRKSGLPVKALVNTINNALNES